MSWKKEPCRNFQRGSCRYGDRCKFLHVNPQQQPKSNPFGFGASTASQFGQTSQQQQSKSNPFGFGVQNAAQSGGATTFGAKPFENKWVRPGTSTPSRKGEPPHGDHKCTDPESCKEIIFEDLKNERPLWKLTCYGHFKYLPCDITGDVSYEELQAAAYEDARRGLPLQSIVERERNLLNSKLVEFENLLQNPYVISQTAKASPFSLINQSVSPPSAKSSFPLQQFSFGQPPGTSTNFGSNNSSGFGRPGPFQNSVPVNSGSDIRSQASSGFFGAQLPSQTFGGSSAPSISNFNSSITATQSSMFPTFQSSALNQSSTFSNPVSQISAVSMDKKEEDEPKDSSIWLKKKWKIKEIPEEEPPARFCV